MRLRCLLPVCALASVVVAAPAAAETSTGATVPTIGNHRSAAELDASKDGRRR
jgi:hypothetical protein